MKSRRTGIPGALTRAFGAAVIIFLFSLGAVANAGVPWPEPAPGQDPQAYQDYCRSESPPGDLVPSSSDFWKYTGKSAVSAYHLFLSGCAPDLYEAELRGVMGASIDEAWKFTTGRPDVLVAGLDCGVRWHDPSSVRDLAAKIYLNPGEAPPPLGGDRWDANGDGVFNVEDYAGDPRAADLNGNGILDPQDLIWALSDGEDDDGNGYVDDVAGWDFFEDDNDPWDEVDAGPEAGWAAWSVGEADNGGGTPGACPNAMFLPVRVSDSSRVMEAGRFAQGLVYAVDSGARVAQAPLRSTGNSSFARAAVEYASLRGTAVVASLGEEGGSWYDFPGAYEGVIRAGAVRKYLETGSFTLDQFPPSYLYLAGNTNRGAAAMLTVPADGERGEAVARLTGIAALVVSAAQDRVKRGEMWPFPGTEAPLSAGEIKQLLIMTADDVDLSSLPPQVSMGHLATIAGPSLRDPSGPGWDPSFGYGRVNALKAVQAVIEGRIPPEAEIRSPRWGDIADPGDITLEVKGRVAAVRADSYSYTVEWGPGSNPSEGEWSTVTVSGSMCEPLDGVLATLDLGPVYVALQDKAGKGGVADDAELYAFTIRVRVRDDRGNWGEDRKTIRCFHDRDAYAGMPFSVGAGVSCPPRLADLDDDGKDELLVADDDGWLHAYRSDLGELAGWPVHATPLPLHTDGAGYRSGSLPRLVFASFTGAPAVGDLDRDGDLEVVAADSRGRVYAWDREGSLLPGFPVVSNPLYSVPDRSDWWTEGALPDEWYASRFTPDRVHRLDRGNALAREFVGGPVLANLDGSGDGSLEILIACRDQHVYAWHMDGSQVRGWPVKAADPDKASRLDPLTHRIEYKDPAGVLQGRGMAAEPTTCDLDGDGDLEVICVTGEVYLEGGLGVSPWSFPATVLYPILKPLLDRAAPESLRPGSTRVYALDHDGACREAPGEALREDMLPAAWVEGWPVRLPTLAAGFPGGLSEGRTCGRPVACDVDGDGRQEVGVSVASGPAFILDRHGRSLRGDDPGGLPLSLDGGRPGEGAASRDAPVLCASGGGCFARLGSDGWLYLAPTLGLGRMMDLLFPARQTGGSDQLSAWKASDGHLAPFFPRRLEGSLSQEAPGATDVDGDGLPEVVAAVPGMVRAFDDRGAEPPGWPRLTGGRVAFAPVSGDLDGDGRAEVFAATLEGWLLGWRTGAAGVEGCWAEHGHDPWNSGWTENDAWRPARVDDLAAEVVQRGEGNLVLELSWTAPGDDGHSGRAMCYEVRWLDRPLDGDNWKSAQPLAGTKPLPGEPGCLEEMVAEGLPLNALSGEAECYVALVTRDEAGNISPVSNSVRIFFGGVE